MSGQIGRLMHIVHELDSITTPIQMYQPLCQDFLRDLDQARYMIKRMLETIYKQEVMDDQ